MYEESQMPKTPSQKPGVELTLKNNSITNLVKVTVTLKKEQRLENGDWVVSFNNEKQILTSRTFQFMSISENDANNKVKVNELESMKIEKHNGIVSVNFIHYEGKTW